MKNNWNVIAKDVGKNQKGTTLWLREYIWGDASDEYNEEEMQNIKVIPYEEWTANDFAQILSNEYEDANYHNFVEAPYEILRAIRETQTSLDLEDKLMKNICERLYDLM